VTEGERTGKSALAEVPLSRHQFKGFSAGGEENLKNPRKGDRKEKKTVGRSLIEKARE